VTLNEQAPRQTDSAGRPQDNTTAPNSVTRSEAEGYRAHQVEMYALARRLADLERRRGWWLAAVLRDEPCCAMCSRRDEWRVA
jgi:hypothetical protein